MSNQSKSQHDNNLKKESFGEPIRVIIFDILSFVKSVWRSFLSLYSVLTKSKFNLSISNLGTTERECIVMGNGPSLNDTLSANIDYMKTKDLVCVNEFLRSQLFSVLKPKYYIFADPVYWNREAIKNDREFQLESCEILKNTIDWPIKMFLPAEALDWNYFAELPKVNPNIQLFYYNKTIVGCFARFKYFLYKKGLAMPNPQNVLISALFLMINTGFKKIYLVGADHSWHNNIFVGKDNVVYRKDHHFFDKKPVKAEPLWDLNKKRTLSMKELFFSWAYNCVAYEELASYASYMGVKICNASEESFIDTFERKKLPKT